jgi:hypothetical protein
LAPPGIAIPALYLKPEMENTVRVLSGTVP